MERKRDLFKNSYNQFHYVNSSVIDPHESLCSMLRIEDCYWEQYVQNCNYYNKANVIEWRRRVAEWIFRVADFFSLDRETASIAISYLDKYFMPESNVSCDKKEFQLVSLCSLFIACKLVEQKPIQMKEMLSMSRSTITHAEMKDMEWKMLKKFHWKLNPPTSLSFIRLFVRYLALSPNGINEILDKSRYLIELSNCDIFFVYYKPSVIGIAAVQTVLDSIGNIQSEEHKMCIKKINEKYEIAESIEVHKCASRLNSTFKNASILDKHQSIEDLVGRTNIEHTNITNKSPSPNYVGSVEYLKPCEKVYKTNKRKINLLRSASEEEGFGANLNETIVKKKK